MKSKMIPAMSFGLLLISFLGTAAVGIGIGDTVKVTANLHVRTGPGTNYLDITDPDYRGVAPAGTLGKVLAGPQSANGYTWWRVDFGPGLYSGWAVQDGMQATSTVQSVTLTLYIHAGSTGGPFLSGVQVTGQDGAGKSFNQTTGASGYVTITGTPGNWRFTASKGGYQNNSWYQDITSTGRKDAFLQMTQVIAPPPHQKPATPIPTSPGTSSEPGQMIDTFTPTLQWNAVSGADYYALAISEYPYGPSNIIHNPQRISRTSYSVPSGVLKPAKKYRWNMQAHSPSGLSEVSMTLYFETKTPPEPLPGGITPRVQVVSSLRIVPAMAAYKIGQTITGMFTIDYVADGPIDFNKMTIGGRLNGECPDGKCPDFPPQTDVTIYPGQSRQYQGILRLDKPGNYHFFVTYQTKDGNWNTSVPTARGITNTIDISVSTQVDLAIPVSPIEQPVLRAAEPEDYGTIIIPRDLFPEGNGSPIPIYVPRLVNGSNSSLEEDGWRRIREISREQVRFDRTKLIGNLGQLQPGARGELFPSLLLSLENAFNKNGFRITVQKNSMNDARAIIQIQLDEGNVLRQRAGETISSPDEAFAVFVSRFLEERFSLPHSDVIYQAQWKIDKKHKENPYAAYMSLSSQKKAIVLTPIVYAKDAFIVTKGIFFSVMKLEGQEYVNAWTYRVPFQSTESPRALELLSETGVSFGSTRVTDTNRSGTTPATPATPQQPSTVFFIPLEKGTYYDDAHIFKFKTITLDRNNFQIYHLGKDYCVNKAGRNNDGTLFGTSLYPIGSGTVVDLRFVEKPVAEQWERQSQGVGNYVTIDHGNRVIAVYMHLAKVRVSKGQNVTSQTPLGESGDVILHPDVSGMCPHLHLEIRKNGVDTLNVPPNLRYAYVSEDGRTKVDKTKPIIDDVKAWIDSRFFDPDVILRPRPPQVIPQQPAVVTPATTQQPAVAPMGTPQQPTVPTPVTTQQPTPAQPKTPTFRELTPKEQAEANILWEKVEKDKRIMNMAIIGEIGKKRLVDNCRQIIRKFPDSEYAFKAKQALAGLSQKDRKRYVITEQEIGAAGPTEKGK